MVNHLLSTNISLVTSECSNVDKEIQYHFDQLAEVENKYDLSGMTELLATISMVLKLYNRQSCSFIMICAFRKLPPEMQLPFINLIDNIFTNKTDLAQLRSLQTFIARQYSRASYQGCFKCHQKDHKTKYCTTENVVQYTNEMLTPLCIICVMPGHSSRFCPSLTHQQEAYWNINCNLLTLFQ